MYENLTDGGGDMKSYGHCRIYQVCWVWQQMREEKTEKGQWAFPPQLENKGQYNGHFETLYQPTVDRHECGLVERVIRRNSCIVDLMYTSMKARLERFGYLCNRFP